MKELHFVVDTQIILIGNGMSNIKPLSHCQLLDYFHTTVFLALDAGGFVQHEYEAKMGEQSPGRAWLTKLAKDNRIKVYSLLKLEKKVRVELDKAHFHHGDRKFVRLPTSTNCRYLIAEDADYSNKVTKILRKHAKIVIHNAESACELIGG